MTTFLWFNLSWLYAASSDVRDFCELLRLFGVAVFVFYVRCSCLCISGQMARNVDGQNQSLCCMSYILMRFSGLFFASI